MKNILFIFIILALISPLGLAKSKSKNIYSNPRIQSMSSADQEMFNALTKSQQDNICSSRIENGYNAWMITLALGDPYYKSEHHPIYKDYEQVWLYTRPQIDKQKNEEKILDPRTNWPTIHRTVHLKTCTVGDFFVLFDRGVAAKIIKDNSGKIYGSCVITNHEDFIPIVDEKNR